MVTPYVVLKWLHVLAAAYLVGSILTEWALRAWMRHHPDRAARAFGWDFLVKGEEKLAIPVALVLLGSGLGMVYGPFAGGWDFFANGWLLGGAAIFLLVLVLMAGVAGSAAKRAHAAYATGRGADEALPHERRYAFVAAVSGLLVVAAVWLMVAKPL